MTDCDSKLRRINITTANAFLTRTTLSRLVSRCPCRLPRQCWTHLQARKPLRHHFEPLDQSKQLALCNYGLISNSRDDFYSPAILCSFWAKNIPPKSGTIRAGPLELLPPLPQPRRTATMRRSPLASSNPVCSGTCQTLGHHTNTSPSRLCKTFQTA